MKIPTLSNMNIQTHSLVRSICFALARTLGILLSLYLFVCSLTLLSISFRILGGRNLSSLFSSSEVLSNPIVGVMIGILITVLVQSSSTSTSIIVSLVSAGVEVKHAIPMIFGSNVGTSVTNTIVSITQAGDRETFGRAFAAATVHDMFNWMSLTTLLVVEISSGALEAATLHVVDAMQIGGTGEEKEEQGELAMLASALGNGTTTTTTTTTDLKLGAEGDSGPDILKALTKPFTDSLVQLDKKILLGWSFNAPEYANVTSLLKSNCTGDMDEPCDYLLAYMGEHGWGLSDPWLGILLLGFSLTLLCSCLIALMKILNSMLGSHMIQIIQKTINAEIPYVPWLTGYIGILVGAVITILVRSSSVFTSTLTPLCGAGLITLETAYPMTLGSNIGTTTTSILASFAAEGKYLKPSIQISMVHLFFNVIGILIFYPIPWMRWPIPVARKLGDLTASYRWFAGLYLVLCFFLLPASIFLLSLAGPFVLYMVLVPFVLLLLAVALINVVQAKKPGWLPPRLRNWEYFPLWMRSLKPMDDLFRKMPCCGKCFAGGEEEEGEGEVGDGDEKEAVGADPADVELKDLDLERGGGGKSVCVIKMRNFGSSASSSELVSLVEEGKRKSAVGDCEEAPAVVNGRLVEA